MVEETERPQTSTRDYEQLKSGLQAWLATQLPAEAAPEVSALEVPSTNGMSSETVLFDLATTHGNVRTAHAYVARVAPEDTAVPVFPTYDLAKQFDVMRLVGERTDVPVPACTWIEPEGTAVGAPFFVMERVEGRVPPDLMPYPFGDNWLYDASREDQRALQDASVEVLAELHQLDGTDPTLAFLEYEGQTDPSALRRHVGHEWDYYQWVSGGVRHPLIEQGFAWLEDHWPADEGPTVLSWGDSRIGNMLYDGFTPVAVLDWEMVGLGPAEIDIAWMVFLHRFFEDIAHQMGLEGMGHFMRRDDVAAHYESVSGHAPRDLDFYLLYAALRDAIVMTRVNQRALHFGEVEPFDDVDDMITHRATLEAMLAGTYWDQLD